MKKTILKISAAFMCAAALVSCSKEKDNENTAVTPTVSNYVLVSVLDDYSACYYSSLGDKLPSGSISNIKSNTRVQNNSGGIIATYKNCFFRNANDAGEKGIEKLTVDASGAIVSKGFISAANTTGNFTILNDNEGFYNDPDRGGLKIQKFNPTTMQRTGEIDFTSQLAKADTSIHGQFLGHTILAAKGGKLFANVHYGSGSTGFLDAKDDTIRIAVIDLATGHLDKVDKVKGVGPQNVGYPSTNRMNDFDDNGDFYFISLGGVTAGSGIFRIKASATEIDKTWSLKIADFKAGSVFAFCTVKNGKIYTRLSTEVLAPNFSNLYSEIYDAYVIDVNTKVSTKITGIPTHKFWGYANQITELDGKIYYGCVSTANGKNGYYEINGTTATQVFNITAGGNVIGLWKLQE